MEIFYLNDTGRAITVQVNGQLKPSPTNPYGEPTIEYFKLDKAEGDIFYIDAPEGSIPYVKVWATGVVLLTYLPVESLESVRQR
jgi:hypothetical protein